MRVWEIVSGPALALRRCWTPIRSKRRLGMPFLGVYGAEGGRQLLKHPVCQRLDPPDRVFVRDQVPHPAGVRIS